jgi:hypothetical protein
MGELLVLTDARRRAAMERSVNVGAPNGATTVSPLTTDPYLASEIRLRATVEYFENKVRSGMNQASVPMDEVGRSLRTLPALLRFT